MSYALTIKVLSCIVPEGDYYVSLAKNTVDKKERCESKTVVSKKVPNPTWTHSVEMYVRINLTRNRACHTFPLTKLTNTLTVAVKPSRTALPTDELIFELYRSKKL
jgi:hypothetical protein